VMLFSKSRLGSIVACFNLKKQPRPMSFCRATLARIMLLQPTLYIIRQSNIEASVPYAL
jgi:hypothetical protein